MVDELNPTESGVLNYAADATDDPSLSEGVEAKKPFEPSYKVFKDSKIPVSKQAGKLWKSRIDAAFNKLKNNGTLDNWDECIRYYKNNQSAKKEDGTTRNRNNRTGGRLGRTSGKETENLVFANTSALVPSIYAKNPQVEITPNIRDDNKDDPAAADDVLRNKARTVERLVNALANKKESPGVNLKPIGRKCVVMTTLTNISWVEIGYTRRDTSSEQAMEDITKLAQDLQNAKNATEIEEAEGALEALEKKTDFLRNSGPYIKFRHPLDVRVDPDAENPDFSDARWMAVADYISTAFINAVYREKNENGEWTSIYAPTHVLEASGESGVQEEVNSFSLLGDNGKTDFRTYGYGDEESFNRAKRTKVWIVYDKVTRRKLMYNSDCWEYPIWVWDDEDQLDRFFPLYPLQFYTDPEDSYGQSEVTMYLDQQDAINDINAEKNKIRKRVMGNLFYNKNLISDIALIEKVLRGDEGNTITGVDVPPDADMQKAFFAMLPPSAQALPLFDKADQYQGINRLSSVDAIMRGEQFKTNTTNQAIETYNSQSQTRLDEKIDAVEDFIGDVLWGIAQLCMMNMTMDEVASILGPNDAQGWETMTKDQIASMFSCQCVGGSTQKPTAAIKKQQALQLGQILGQYAQAGGGAVVLVMLSIMERAFDEVVISDEDWQQLKQAIVSQVQAQQQQAQAPPQGAQPQQPQEQPHEFDLSGLRPEQILQMVDQLASQLPPEAVQAIGLAFSKGAPLATIVPRVVAAMEGQQAQQQPQQA